jgi:hypothetical protein
MNALTQSFPSSFSSAAGGLVACVACGSMVGRSARCCVNCGTPEPAGVPCHFCEEPMAKAEAVSCGHRFFHKSCLSKVFAIPPSIRCPDCGRSLAALSPLWKIPHSCTYCGADTPLTQNGQHPIYRCSCCTLPIFTAYQEYHTGSGENAHYCTQDSLHSHAFCIKEQPQPRWQWNNFFQKCLAAWVL